MKKMSTEHQGNWPEHLVVPDFEQFSHGIWLHRGSPKSARGKKVAREICKMANGYGGTVSESSKDHLRYDCNTQCCLVGWACLAFGENGISPDHIQNDATALFLNKIIELSGQIPIPVPIAIDSSFRYQVGSRASGVFEGIRGAKPRLTSGKARKLWREAGNYFGYDTKELLEA